MQSFELAQRKIIADHPLVRAVTALPEMPPGSERQNLSTIPELGHLPRDQRTDKIKYLSPSQVKTWTRCGAQYYYQYRLGMRDTTNSKAFFGTCTHTGAEIFCKAKRAAQLAGKSFNFERALQLAIAGAQHHATERLPHPMIWKPLYWKGPDETHRSLVRGVGVAVRELAFLIWRDLDPIFVERGFIIEWHDENVLPVLVYPDLLYRIGGKLEILDNKTGAEKKELSLNTDVALPLGALAASLFLEEPITQAVYANYARTKVPKSLKIPGTLTQDAYERAFVRVKIATTAIRDEIFMPADDDFTCSGCLFTKICWKWNTLSAVPKTPAEFAPLTPQSSACEVVGPIDIAALLAAIPRERSRRT